MKNVSWSRSAVVMKLNKKINAILITKIQQIPVTEYHITVSVPDHPWLCNVVLTHWGRVTHICVSKITIIGSDNGLSPGRRQVIIWTNVGILLIGPCGTNFHEILIESQTFSFKKMHFKMSSGKWRPFCLGLNVLNFKFTKYPSLLYGTKTWPSLCPQMF